TRPYFDWFETPVKNEEGGIEYQHLQRARAHRFEFGHVSASAGVSYLRHRSTFKLILGKSFRMPQPHELASDGVNYHMYRYEKGQPDLDPETAWQLDFEFDHTAENWNLNISPFVNYFGNYIYLNPSARYYETLQIDDHRP